MNNSARTGARSAMKGKKENTKRVADCMVMCVDLADEAPTLFEGKLRPAYRQPERRRITVQKMAGGLDVWGMTVDDLSSVRRSAELALDEWIKRRENSKSSGDGAIISNEQNIRALAKIRDVRHRVRRNLRNKNLSEDAILAAQDEAEAAQLQKLKENFGGDIPETLHDVAWRKEPPSPMSISAVGTTKIKDDQGEMVMKSPLSTNAKLKDAEETAANAAKWPLLRAGDIRSIPRPVVPGSVDTLLSIDLSHDHGDPVSVDGTPGGARNAYLLKEDDISEQNIKVVWFATNPQFVYNAYNEEFLHDKTNGKHLDIANRPAYMDGQQYKIPPVWKASNIYNHEGDDSTTKKAGKGLATPEKINALRNKVSDPSAKAEVDKYEKELAAWHLKPFHLLLRQWNQKKNATDKYVRWYMTLAPGEEAREPDAYKKAKQHLLKKEGDKLSEDGGKVGNDNIYLIKRIPLLDEDGWDRVGMTSNTSHLTDEEFRLLDIPFPEWWQVADSTGQDAGYCYPPYPPDPPNESDKPVSEPMPKKPSPATIPSGQGTKMELGPDSGSASSFATWENVPSFAFDDPTFKAIWNRLTKCGWFDESAGRGPPPNYIKACQPIDNQNKHKSAYVLGYALYDASEWARCVAEKEYAVSVDDSTQFALRQKHLQDAVVLEAQRKQAALTGVAASGPAFNAFADETKIIADFSKKNAPATFFPRFGRFTVRDFDDKTWWDKYSRGQIKSLPGPNPKDTNAMGGLNGLNGIRYESNTDYEARVKEWEDYEADKLAGKPTTPFVKRLPWRPVQHEAAYYHYARLAPLPPGSCAELSLQHDSVAGSRGGKKWKEDDGATPDGQVLVESYVKRLNDWERLQMENMEKRLDILRQEADGKYDAGEQDGTRTEKKTNTGWPDRNNAYGWAEIRLQKGRRCFDLFKEERPIPLLNNEEAELAFNDYFKILQWIVNEYRIRNNSYIFEDQLPGSPELWAALLTQVQILKRPGNPSLTYLHELRSVLSLNTGRFEVPTDDGYQTFGGPSKGKRPRQLTLSVDGFNTSNKLLLLQQIATFKLLYTEAISVADGTRFFRELIVFAQAGADKIKAANEAYEAAEAMKMQKALEEAMDDSDEDEDAALTPPPPSKRTRLSEGEADELLQKRGMSPRAYDNAGSSSAGQLQQTDEETSERDNMQGEDALNNNDLFGEKQEEGDQDDQGDQISGDDVGSVSMEKLRQYEKDWLGDDSIDTDSAMQTKTRRDLARVHRVVLGERAPGQPVSYAALGAALRSKTDGELEAFSSKLQPRETVIMMKCWEAAGRRARERGEQAPR